MCEKTFGRRAAVDDLTFTVGRGEVFALPGVVLRPGVILTLLLFSVLALLLCNAFFAAFASVSAGQLGTS